MLRLKHVRERLTPPGEYRNLLLRAVESEETTPTAQPCIAAMASVCVYLVAYTSNQPSSLGMSLLTMRAFLSPKGTPSVT